MWEEDRVAMEKRVSSRQSTVPYPKGNGCSGENNSNKFPRNTRKREPATNNNNNSNSSNVSRKPAPQKWRSAGDKRPRSRTSNLLDRQREEVAEYGIDSSKNQSKKGNLNHLLNFSFAPREVETFVGGNVQGFRRTKTGRVRFDKKRFLQANCQFVVQDVGDYEIYSADPDKLVDWDLVELVRLFSLEEPLCPICLDTPVAAKVTRCGHVFCWSCILHLLSFDDGTWAECPICYSPVLDKDLRSAECKVVRPYKVGDVITMKLMKREAGSTYSVPRDRWRERYGKPHRLSDEETLTRYMKLLVASPDDILERVIEREKTSLQTQLVDCESSEVCFIETALAQLKEREDNLLLKICEEENPRNSSKKRNKTSLTSSRSMDEDLSHTRTKTVSISSCSSVQSDDCPIPAARFQLASESSVSDSDQQNLEPDAGIASPSLEVSTDELTGATVEGTVKCLSDDGSGVASSVVESIDGGNGIASGIVKSNDGGNGIPSGTPSGIVGSIETLQNDDGSGIAVGIVGSIECLHNDDGSGILSAAVGSVKCLHNDDGSGIPSAVVGSVKCLHNDDVGSNMPSEVPEDVTESKQDSKKKPKNKHIYSSKNGYFCFQASDGQHIYIHNINSRCLTHEYGSLENSPGEISATIVDIRAMNMTEEARLRTKYLSHLPLSCVFSLVELSLKPPVLSRKTLDLFQNELDQKRRLRQRKVNKEKLWEKKASLEENKRLGIYPGLNIPLQSEAQFPVYRGSPEQKAVNHSCQSPPGHTHLADITVDVEELSLNCEPTSSPEDNSSSVSFAQMLKHGPAKPQQPVWPKLSSKTEAFPSLGGSTSSQTIMVDSDGSEIEDYVPVPEYGHSFGSAIQAALDNAVSKSASKTPKPKPASGKNKKSKKQKLLFSTWAPRSTQE